MKVMVDGATIDLGTTETAPTISIVDYSRRETDDFGVTRLVVRGFARRMSVRLALPFDSVDALQRRLASLRATPAIWIADDDHECLTLQGFYKDFAIDLAVPPTSFCTLTVEGLTETGAMVDTGIDPAADGNTSSLQLLRPIVVGDAVLTATNVPENDFPEWSGLTSYGAGARVIVAASHSVFESATAANVGNHPDGLSGKWIYVGLTNRWAMFDQANGTLTQRAGSIVVTLDPGEAVNALALLDVTASTVRVQAAGYDRTQALPSSPTQVTFLDLPLADGPVTVTISGAGDVAVGTFLLGALLGLGVTESSPSASITDFSRKDTDEFGDVTVVERAWVKRMNVRALIATGALDTVVARMAGVRARPCLWIGQDGVESLTIYGFFKDFSVEVGASVSTLSLSVEGLSTAARVVPLTSDVAWTDIADNDPAHPKPSDGATVGAPAGTPIGSSEAQAVVDGMIRNSLTIAEEALRDGTWRAATDEIIKIAGGATLRQLVEQLGITVGGVRTFVDFLRSVDSDGNAVWALTAQNSNGKVTGVRNLLTGEGVGTLQMAADILEIVDPDGGNARFILRYGLDNRLILTDVYIENLEVGSVVTASIDANAVSSGDTASLASPIAGDGAWHTPVSYYVSIPTLVPAINWQYVAIVTGSQSFPSGDRTWNARLKADGVQIAAAGGMKSEDSFALSGRALWGAGPHNFTLEWNGESGCSLSEMNMTILWFKR